MLKEELAKASDRFLIALARFSGKAVDEWQKEAEKRDNNECCEVLKKFVNWKPQENEIAIFTSYAYADFLIPRQFDCLFEYNDPQKFIRIPYILTQSIWEGWHPIDCIEHGHKHLVILSFETDIPDILFQLNCVHEKYASPDILPGNWLGLCSYDNLSAIIAERDELKKQTDDLG